MILTRKSSSTTGDPETIEKTQAFHVQVVVNEWCNSYSSTDEHV